MPANYNLPALNSTAFDNSVREKIGTISSIFNPMMTAYPIPAGNEAKTWNQGGRSASAKAYDQRFGDTTYQDIDFEKRTFFKKYWDVDAIPIDEFADLDSISFSPENHYVKMISEALNKKRNDVFIDAFEEDVIVTNILNADGTTGTTTRSFNSSNIIARDFNSSGTNTALSLTKLDELINRAEDNKLIGDEFEHMNGFSLCMLMTERQSSLLYNQARTSSSEYATFFKWDPMKNRISNYRSIKFVYFSSNIKEYTATDTIQKLYAWHPKAFIYDPENVKSYASSNMPEKKYNGQVYSKMAYNVMRVYEEAAFRVDCKK